MSRIGKQPVAIPAGVKVKLEGKTLTVEGAKTKLVQTFHEKVNVAIEDGGKSIVVTRPDEERLSRSLHGLTRSLIANMVHGVTKGFETKLKVVGLGYQARMNGKTIVLSVGYSNQIELTPPEGVTVEVLDKEGTSISVKGADKQKVGQFAAEIRAARKPEPYKGKGVRYDGENVRQKEGKTFASGG